MLSAHKLGVKGVEYYVSYAGRGTEGYWLGKAAASLGLVGAVDPAAFRALAKGEHPDGGRLLERVATDHTPGWNSTITVRRALVNSERSDARENSRTDGAGSGAATGTLLRGSPSPASYTPPRVSSIRSSIRMGSSAML